MASAVNICNLALAHLGERPNVSSIAPPEGSSHAEKCAQFYPIARDVALEMRNWPFALKRVALTEVTNDSYAYQFKYALPADCIRPVSVFIPGFSDENTDTADFMVEGTALYTNAETASLRYLFRQTDTGKFSPLFVNALSWLLASYLAGSICEDKQVKNWAYDMFNRELGLGAQSSANGTQTTQSHVAPWMKNR